MKSTLINMLAIVYLLFVIVYLLNAPTTAYFSDENMYHGTMSAADQFEEQEEDELIETETEEGQAIDGKETEPLEQVENNEGQSDNEQPQALDNDHKDESKQIKQQPDTPAEQQTKEPKENKSEIDDSETY